MNRRDLMRSLGLAVVSLPWAEEVFTAGSLASPSTHPAETFTLMGDTREVPVPREAVLTLSESHLKY